MASASTTMSGSVSPYPRAAAAATPRLPSSSFPFPLGPHCFTIPSSRLKGSPHTFPSPLLRLLLESAGLTLSSVFSPPPFPGRHSALRHLRSSLLLRSAPPSWWLRVAFPRRPFSQRHVSILSSLLRRRIADGGLPSLVEALFEEGVLGIDIGGSELRRGFPQECGGIAAVLVDIYFEGFDRLVRKIGEKVKRENPLVKVGVDGSSRVFQRPARVFAVRYLDEILVATSGSKKLMMDVRDEVLQYLEEELELELDKSGSSIHSAVSEKLTFLGMELQAVPPSVLHPQMSEKAMRARKKYLKRKEVMAQELRNARETRRKKLGLEILWLAVKKLRKTGGFEFNFRIEDEVRELFRKWGKEVAREFFSSKDECWDLYRGLSGGNFLELKKIRDQLPVELVDAYDQFRKNVDKYLMPGYSGVSSYRELNSEEEKEDEQQEIGEDFRDGGVEEEEKRYAERTIDDLTKLRVKVDAPIKLVRQTVKLAGFTNLMGRPRPIKLLICLEDRDIVKWYAGIARRWLDFYCCCHNFKMVKTIVNYHLRYSCILTLAEKHEATKLQTIKHYTKDLKVVDTNGKECVYFPTEREIKMMGRRRLLDPMPVDSTLGLILVRLASGETSSPCVGYFCEREDVSLYRVRLLQNRLNIDPLNEKKWVPGLGAIHECMNKKCLPLCSKHASDLYLGRISLQDVDCTSFVDVK